MDRSRHLGLALCAAVGLIAGGTASAVDFTFSTGNPDGRMGAASRPAAPGHVEVETADDFTLTATTAITSATFTGLLPAGTVVDEVAVELYRIFPFDSGPPSGHVVTRSNSPADVAFDARAFSEGGLTFTFEVLSDTFTAQNSVLDGIHRAPNQTTRGEGPVTGVEVRFSVQFDPPFELAPGHYFFKPSATSFFWLSAPKTIPAPADLQAWVRDETLAPDWSRIGSDIVGGNPAPAFNMSFTLSGVGASLDIRPGECPNVLNRKSQGVVPVALVGDRDLDLSDIELDSIRLCRVDGVGGCVAPLEGPRGPHSVLDDVSSSAADSGCDCQATAPDGVEDLVMFFSTQELVIALQLGSLDAGAHVELRITATRRDGAPFVSGTDCIVIAPSR